MYLSLACGIKEKKVQVMKGLKGYQREEIIARAQRLELRRIHCIQEGTGHIVWLSRSEPKRKCLEIKLES